MVTVAVTIRLMTAVILVAVRVERDSVSTYHLCRFIGGKLKRLSNHLTVRSRLGSGGSIQLWCDGSHS